MAGANRVYGTCILSFCATFADEINSNVQVTLQILTALIEKAPRDLPLYAEYVLKILNIILRSKDITMVEASTSTFKAFCEHHDGASLFADQEYSKQYEDIVGMYASFASTRTTPVKDQTSAPVCCKHPHNSNEEYLARGIFVDII